MPAARRGAIVGSSATTTPAAASPASSSNMASFSFGAPAPGPAAPAFGAAPAAPAFGAPAPAPAAGGFSFGGPAPAPAPGGGGLFGGNPAPAPSGGLFGGPAPAPGGGGLFGAPAPAPGGGGLFGAPAPAPGGGLFGAPAPAPGGGLFGTPAPAPGGGGLFGTPAPAPGGGLFGAPAPAPAGGLFGAPAPSAFGSAPAGAPQQNQTMAMISGNMPYSSLPEHHKKSIDELHKAIMQHKRTMLMVSTMAPKLLQDESNRARSSGVVYSQADAGAGPSPGPGITKAQDEDLPIGARTANLASTAVQLQSQLDSMREDLAKCQAVYENSVSQAIRYAQWPTEAVAMRRGIRLDQTNKDKTKDETAKLQELLDRQIVHVDRIERMPSPFMWETLKSTEERLVALHARVQLAIAQIKKAEAALNDPLSSAGQHELASILKNQEDAIWSVASSLGALHTRVEHIRQRYAAAERDPKDNVLKIAMRRDKERQERIDNELRRNMLKTPAPPPTSATPAPAPGGGLFGPAPAPGGGLFGSAPAPATGGLFGSTPAPSSGGLFGGFGSTPAPAPGGGLFGSTPAPASGGLFGSTPAPAPGGLFGSTPAPAPAGGGLFGSAPAPAPGGLFGSTPAPAPAGGGLFGSTAAPSMPTFGAAPAASTATTPRSKNRSRSGRRR